MTAPDLTAPAADMGRAIAAGRLDPVELAEAMLTASAEHPDIYARTTPARARAEAEAAALRARAGTRRGPLDGVPISWKDLFDTAGTATEGGSAILRGRVPDRDARVLENATAQGLVCLGKTHMTELAFSGLGVNPVTATPPNRHDPSLAPGGSSSGAAASVGYGLAAAGIGSDTGGSVRAPSAWNDLVGFKTSVGSLPMRGVIPLCARFDTIGPLARTVEDAALLYAAMGNNRAPDLGGADPAGARFLVLDNPAVAPLDDAPQAAFEGALSRLSAAGATIGHATLAELEQAMTLTSLFPAEAWGTWGDAIRDRGASMHPPIRARFEAGQTIGAARFVADWQTLDRLRAGFAEATAGYDAVLLPTVAILPPRTADLLADDEEFTARNLETLRNTRVGNLMNLTGLTLPTGTRHCGLMLLCPPGHEARALRLGAAVEKSL
ncbi:amidase [Rhodobacteraceae bacterium 2CG4]|uniref:Amidase n=1 Tax=Halovulum marinum TaxID=2662447 RepID=A0A6L5Z3T3_9RHOB|nr:amidase family protein [Halovulum marinum]MSU91206.1 amidase [Halovulum marinum]